MPPGKPHSPATASKPTLRGISHIIAAVVSLPAGAWLAHRSPTREGARAGLAFTASLFFLFAASGIYHTFTWRPSTRKWLRRLDHAAIFILIAGTYTPICLLALKAELGDRILLLVWGGALMGLLQSLFFVSLPKAITACLYLALGWIGAWYREEILARTGWRWCSLILGGGVLYSIGAFAYMLKWPNPFPKSFGYHEVFHCFVILAAATHFAAIAKLVLTVQ